MVKTRFPNKLLNYVRFVQAFINIALPSFAYGYYLKNFPLGDYNLKTNFLNSSFQLFPIVIIFIFFMQIVRASSFEKNLKQAFLDLVLPFAYLAVANIIYAKSITWYLFKMGAVYGSSLLLAFLIIVFFTVIIEGSIKNWSTKTFLSYGLMAIPQLIFLLPGIIGVYFFNRLIIQDIIGNNNLNLYVVINILAYVASLVQVTIFNYRWMRSEAAI